MSTELEVDISDFEAANHGSLYTLGIATCVRIAITGSYRNGSRGDDRFLAHIGEEKTEDKSSYINLPDFVDAIHEALSNGLKIDEMVIVAGDVTMDPEYHPDDEGWQDEKSGQDEFNDAVIDAIRDNFGQVKVAWHSTYKSWELCITADKEIVFKNEARRGANYKNFEEWQANPSDGDDDEDEEDEDDDEDDEDEE